MARIQKPQELSLRAGSTGVKTDIDINSPQFRAIAGLGQAAGQGIAGVAEAKKRAIEEGQRLSDRAASEDVNREGRIFQQELNNKIAQVGREGGYEAQVAAFDSELQAREERINEQIAEASVEKQNEIRAAWEDQKKAMRVDFDFQRAEEKRLLDNKKIYNSALDEAMIGNLDKAIEIADGMSLNENEAFEIGEQLREVRGDAIYQEIAITSDPEEVDRLNKEAQESEISKSAKNKIQKQATAQKKRIASATYTKLGSELTVANGIVSRIESGDFFTEEEIQALPIAKEDKDLIRQAGKELKGGFTQSSTEYKQAIEFINNKFEEDPMWAVGKGEVSAKTYKEIYDLIENTGFDTGSQFALISHLMRARAIDAKEDNDLFGSLKMKETAQGTVLELVDGEIAVNDSQQAALFQASNALGSSLRMKGGKVDPLNTSMSFLDYTDLFLTFQSPEFIKKFEKVDPESKEFDDLYKREVTDRIAKAKGRTAIQKLRDKVLSLRSEQLRIRL